MTVHVIFKFSQQQSETDVQLIRHMAKLNRYDVITRENMVLTTLLKHRIHFSAKPSYLNRIPAAKKTTNIPNTHQLSPPEAISQPCNTSLSPPPSV